MPLHPAIVHLPIGLALVMPFLAAGLAFAIWRGKLPALAFGIVVGLQAAALGAGFAAYATGGDDQRKVERVVAEKVIEAHEEAAELYLWSQAVALALAAGVLAARGKAVRVALGVAIAASAGVSALALRAGTVGGELVYRHGAASVFVSEPPVIQPVSRDGD